MTRKTDAEVAQSAYEKVFAALIDEMTYIQIMEFAKVCRMRGHALGLRGKAADNALTELCNDLVVAAAEKLWDRSGVEH